jgi:hypothetical protein
MNCPKIPASAGELLDKITILQIKSSYSDDEYIKRKINDETQSSYKEIKLYA